jgi:peroxiredoxin
MTQPPHSHRKQRQQQERRQKQILLLGGVGLTAVLIIGLILLSQSSTGSGRAAPYTGPATQGKPAPDFTLPTLDGAETSLSDYAGQVVVVNFWATWCPPCKAEMPGINDYYEARKADGLTVLAVNAQEDQATVEQFITANGFSFPVLLDGRGQAVQRYQVHSFPSTFIIDRQGTLQAIHTGLISPQQLDALVAPLLDGT